MTKAEVTLAIFKEVVAEHTTDGVIDYKAVRKICIDRFVKEAGMTPAGAATYYANCKNRDGATGSYVPTQHRKASDPNYNPNYVETDEPCTRPLYSAVQLDKNGKVAACAVWHHTPEAVAKAKRVRGIAVVGAPEIGDDVSTLVELEAGFTCECCKPKED